MSVKVRPLTLSMVNEMQLVQSNVEAGDYLASLLACGRAEAIAAQLRIEVLLTMEEQHRDEMTKRKAEIDDIRRMMPVKNNRLLPSSQK